MKKLLIDNYTNKIKIVKLDNGELDNVYILEKTNMPILGNIYLGVIEKIVNKHLCFINIGLEKNVFVDLKDTKEKILIDTNPKIGSQLLVEIIKEGTHDKLPLATSQVSHYNKNNIVVMKEKTALVRVSKSISKDERARLKNIGNSIKKDYSILFRTASSGMSEEQISKEYSQLVEYACDLEKKVKYYKAPMLIKESGYQKFVFGLCNGVDEIAINDLELKDLLEKVVDTTIVYKNDIIVDYGIDIKIDRLFNKKIWLKSGGFIYIEELDTAVFIDVNTGKMVNGKNSEKSKFKVNSEALQEIFKQIKLRNLSGMIIIDMINMTEEDNRDTLFKHAKNLAKEDYSKISVVGFSDLGLLQLTRKKEMRSLTQSNSSVCKNCSGTGVNFDNNFICDKIFRELYWFTINTNKSELKIKCCKNIQYELNKSYVDLISSIKNKFDVKINIEVVNNSQYDYYEIV